MSEKRKPELIMLLKYSGKKKSGKVELFDSKLWVDGRYFGKRSKTPRYRIRVNGKWFNSEDGHRLWYTKTEFRNLLMRSLKI